MDMLAPEIVIPFVAILAVVAFLYASVGHGGASGYLALMALFSFSPAVMKPTALLLNIFVSGIPKRIHRIHHASIVKTTLWKRNLYS